MGTLTCKFKNQPEELVTDCTILPLQRDKDGNFHGVSTDNAMWDTGSTNTSVSREIVDSMGLKPCGKALIDVYGGREVEADVYKINLLLGDGILIKDLQVLCAEGIAHDVVLGMDVFQHGDLAITNADTATWLSFRVPAKEHIDFTK